MLVIFGLSAQSNPLPEVTAHVWDKLLHTSEYGGLAVLLVRALRGEGLSWGVVIALATVIASLYGMSDEIHQSFVPGRDAAVGDWVADTTGGLIGSLVARRAASWMTQRRCVQPAVGDRVEPASGEPKLPPPR
jgi:VanZ family protein